jgi:two-component system chemotaxis response regulator CheV
MSGLLDQVDLRTQLVGENRLEVLMFRLHGEQLFGINVFKVQEVQQMPKLTLIPRRHPIIVGVTHVRGQTIPVIDLSKAIEMAPMEDFERCNVIIAEYNMSVQAFMVGSVDRIVNLTWDQVTPPPRGAGTEHYLTAITRVEDKIVEIIDVEKVLAKFMNYANQVSDSLMNQQLTDYLNGQRILIVDDSSVAVHQLSALFGNLGIDVEVARNGVQAWERLAGLKSQDINPAEYYFMMVTDAEMPGMDGYRLTHMCREDAILKKLFIVMHTSMSGEFNREMVKKVQCDGFIAKFNADHIAEMLKKRIDELAAQSA